jgi:hypothetical protein
LAPPLLRGNLSRPGVVSLSLIPLPFSYRRTVVNFICYSAAPPTQHFVATTLLRISPISGFLAPCSVAPVRSAYPFGRIQCSQTLDGCVPHLLHTAHISHAQPPLRG